MTGRQATPRLTPDDHTLLLDLLSLPTVGPLEQGPDAPPPELWFAQHRYAAAAAELGFTVVHHAAPDARCLQRLDTPLTVCQAAAEQPEFLTVQPSLVLSLGPDDAARERTVMANVHLDTVAGQQPVSFDGHRFHGRGAIDAKGPAVALLAGVRAAVAAQPDLPRDTRILIQAVSGEEGGALGTFGTRPLVEAGHYGRLNLFCEPTGGRALLRSTASMTARIEVTGEDAVDDRPGSGHNATVLLGFLAHHLAVTLDAALDPADGQICVAGLHTGTLHNRVYGRGSLLVNLSYRSAAVGRRLERRFLDAVRSGLRAFTDAHRDSSRLARTAADAPTVTRVTWLKRGLPALDSTYGEHGAHGAPAWLLPLLARADVPLWPAEEPAFTCDAIWTAGLPDAHTVVLGPGSLDANHAHADGEFADLSDLDGFADTVARLLTHFRAAEQFTAEQFTAEQFTAKPFTDQAPPAPSARSTIPHAAVELAPPPSTDSASGQSARRP
ncbi:M20/M25/M40 family metallo-hydrolase [Streptacidiphilus sp. MAP5-3]|uniref:M20/M25/M40 family metallo-hydrolase n=1 Tax=unclassified Streptacidiphilus TaxID=2643834 RepID=UPI003515B73A